MFCLISDYGFNVWTHEEIRGARSQLHWPCGGENIAYCLLGCNLVLVVQYLSNILSILEFPMPMQSDPPHMLLFISRFFKICYYLQLCSTHPSLCFPIHLLPQVLCSFYSMCLIFSQSSCACLTPNPSEKIKYEFYQMTFWYPSDLFSHPISH